LLGGLDGKNASQKLKLAPKALLAARILLLIVFAVVPSLCLGLLTLLALWMGAMQFFLLKWGRAPDPQLLVLGCTGAAGLCGLWMLILIPIERLRGSARLRGGATVASLIGMVLALLFLSGKGIYGWDFGNHPDIRSAYLLGAPFLLTLGLLYEAWRPLKPSS
jgi:hypothetical protein